MARVRLLLRSLLASAIGMLTPAAAAETVSGTVVLDGTSGSNTIATSFDLTGNTTFALAFEVDYLILAGGGAGGDGTGGGGGAGGLLVGSEQEVSATGYPVVVGAGGAAITNQSGGGGGDSSAFSLTAIGGGGGGTTLTGKTKDQAGGDGGSGGGGTGPSGTAGDGEPGQGTNGGGTNATVYAAPNFPAAGGGGAGTAGASPASSSGNGGAGGDGLSSTITGSAITYAGGGGGGIDANGLGGAGGAGGGGKGADAGLDNAVAGSNGLGGGGGGGSSGATGRSADGGSGVVIVRYPGDQIAGAGGTQTSFIGDGTIGELGVTYQVSSFTADGTFDLSGVDFNERLGARITGSITGSGNLTYAGPGELTLLANSSYIGRTSITGGTLHVGNGGATGSLGTGDISISVGATLFCDRNDGHTIPNGLSGQGDIVVRCGGSLVLGDASGFNGTTTVLAGRLAVDGVLGGAVVITGGELGGQGVIESTVLIESAGTLAPGSSIAALASHDLTMDAGATYAYEVDSTDLEDLSTAADLMVVNGDLTIAAGSELTFTDLGTHTGQFPHDVTVFALLNYNGTWNGGLFTYNGQLLTDGSHFVADGQGWEIQYAASGTPQPLNFTGSYLHNSSFVTVTAVPEPSMAGMLSLAGIGAVLAAYRRRRVHRSGVPGRDAAW